MGLNGPKKRNKISSDPNNTTWANNKEGYGQKILAAQGWTQGDYLGARSANHADHYTAANASHIRVLLREDNLGLGAQVGKSTADTFGLATLSGIFGRLNGKSDADIQKQQDIQRDLQLQTYQTTKFGTMNFVSGGLLVGDKMEFPSQKPTTTVAGVPVKTSDATGTKRSEKRKIADEDDVNERASAKKRKQATVTDDKVHASRVLSEEDSSTAERKKRKKRRHEAEAEAGEDVSQPTSDTQDNGKNTKVKKLKRQDSSRTSSSDQTSLKEEKRARKEERRLRRERKEEKRRQKAAKLASNTSSKSASTTSSDTEIAQAVPVAAVQIQAPAMFGGSRHAVRQRYIQQKRLASMDPRAIQEILMLKTSA